MVDTNTILEKMGYKQELKRVLTLRDLVIYGIAFMTPIAPALIYGYVTNMTGGMMALAYCIAMVAMMFTAYSYGRMAAAFPVAGSTYSYTQRAINPHLGFLAGWGMYMDYVLVPLIVLMMGGAYANALIPMVPYWAWVLIIGAIIALVNFWGIEMTAKTNNFLVLFMAIVVVIFILTCLKTLAGGTGEGTILSIKPFYNQETFAATALFSGAAMACFSFLGFDSITTLSEEALRPETDIGRAAVLACLFGGIIFILQAYVAQLVWPDISTFSSADTALFDVIKLAGGSILATLYTSAVIVSTLTAGLTGQASAARVMYGMGRDEMLPRKFFTYLHPKYKTPTNNLIIMCVIGIVGALTLPISLVAELMNFGALLGFMCVNLSVIAYYFFLKKDRNVIRHLLVPAAGFLICLYLWIHLSQLTLKIGFVWLAIGVVYAVIITKGFRKTPPIFREL